MSPKNTISIVQEVVAKNTQTDGSFAPNNTSDIYRYECNQGEYCWTAYVGSNPNSTGAQLFNAAVIDGPPPALSISIGWLFLYGRNPVGQSETVTAGAVGTSMLMQHEGPSGVGTVYVVFMGKTYYSDTVQVASGTAAESLDMVGKFAAVTAPGDIILSHLDADPDRKKAVDDILQMLNNVGANILS